VRESILLSSMYAVASRFTFRMCNRDYIERKRVMGGGGERKREREREG